MAVIQNFRRSLNGFNREDVVQYIDFINKKHTTQVNQLKAELQEQKEQLEKLQARPQHDPELEEKLAKSEEERAELQQQFDALQEAFDQLKAQVEQKKPEVDELEAYRRAERVERLANERVAQMYCQANVALEQATTGVASTASQIGQIADSVATQLQQMQTILESSKQTMEGTADMLKSIRPLEPEC